MSVPPIVERVGLLFVHGIGEQKRFEHLRASVVDFAELMRQSGEPGEQFSASVVDRTDTWKPEPGQAHPDGLSPITLTIESLERRLVFECHEVWWADLGARTGIADSSAFWFWGIGQWLAPIYRDLDAADLGKVKIGMDNKAWTKPASKLVKLPEAVAGRFGPECLARARLAMAALATLFVVVSWVVLKRLFSAALNQAPSPTLLVSYVGDVRTYEERATPGGAAPGDPGQPRRVGIRRRMVAEMVAMGARKDLDRWYVVAHSQGTVLAYNGLTEIGHALPNYLDIAQWKAVPGWLKRDQGCERRPKEEIADMMPGRPPWLVDEDVLNRHALFKNLRGFVTYGSPLNKFAAIWPRIVATATDRKIGAPPPFADDCRWINLRALQDPVAGDVSRFFNGRDDRPSFAGCIPPIQNIEAPFRPNFLLAHLKYFAVSERFADRLAITQRQAMVRWIMTSDASLANTQIAAVQQPRGKFRQFAVALLYICVLAVLAFLAVATVTLGGDLLGALFGKANLVWIGLFPFAKRALCNVVPLLAASVSVLAAAGYGRWIREARLNMQLAAIDELLLVVRLLRAQLVAAVATAALVIAGSLWVETHLPTGWRLETATFFLCLSTALCVAGVVVEALVNLVAAKPLRYSEPEGRGGRSVSLRTRG